MSYIECISWIVAHTSEWFLVHFGNLIYFIEHAQMHYVLKKCVEYEIAVGMKDGIFHIETVAKSDIYVFIPGVKYHFKSDYIWQLYNQSLSVLSLSFLFYYVCLLWM